MAWGEVYLTNIARMFPLINTPKKAQVIPSVPWEKYIPTEGIIMSKNAIR